jgi:transforming growth factor-beta-induced protein
VTGSHPWVDLVQRAEAAQTAPASPPFTDALPLVLKPADGAVTASLHRAHSSHASHASHASHYSGSGAPPVAPAPPRATPPAPIVAPPVPVTPVAPPQKPAQQTLLEALGAEKDLARLNGLVSLAEVSGILKGKGPFTILAPPDAALDKMPKEELERLLKPENRTKFKAFVNYHIVVGALPMVGSSRPVYVRTIAEQRLTLTGGTTMRIGSSHLSSMPLTCSNGVIYRIDTPLAPATDSVMERLDKDGRFGKFIAALNATDLGPVLRTGWVATVFAPTDVAFDQMGAGAFDDLMRPANKTRLEELLRRHIVPGRFFSDEAAGRPTMSSSGGDILVVTRTGDQLSVNGVLVSNPDIEVSNGVIHAVNGVVPGSPPEPAVPDKK